jgi:polysaccharide biosynthesis transport protein
MQTVKRTSTRDAITVLTRSWILILGFAVAFGLIALLLCLLKKPVYEATAPMYVTSGTNQRPSSAYEDAMGSQTRVNSWVRLVDSDAVLAPAVKAAGLDMTVDEARMSVRAQTTPETALITVSAKNENPDVARRLANAVAESMVDKVAELEVPTGGGRQTSRLTALNSATVNPIPVSPTTSINVGLAVIGGLFVGVVTALARERFNDTVRDEQDVDGLVDARPIARVPHDRVLSESRIIDFRGPGTPAAAAFRHLRNGLSAKHSDRPLVKILVTSPRAGEGKSTIALNIAAALSEGGNSVVVIDADLDEPVVATRTESSEAPGLADAIHSRTPISEILQVAAFDGLSVVSAGRMGDNNSADLLVSAACGNILEQLAESFDYAIIDASSFLDAPDTEAMARWVDGVLLVGQPGRSKISDVNDCVARLSDVRAEVVGVVLNDSRFPGRHARSKDRSRRAVPQSQSTLVGGQQELRTATTGRQAG